MDIYKKEMNKRCGGIGGLHCECCNKFFGKEKKILNRIVRRVLKHDLKKEIEQ